MCGIAAIFSARGPARALDLKFLKHRGPDGSGEWTAPDGRTWLGHTRLAIVDLSPTGAQPMHDAETGNVIVFNGEIYNHAELRAEMGGAGGRWVGGSDTETLLAGYRLWGGALLERVRGMFAFAIFDKARDHLFVARDPLGIKPVYFEESAGTVRMASEIRVLAAGTSRKCSQAGVSGFLQWGSCPEAGFLFPEIKMLPAGHHMIVGSDGAITTRRYWPPPAVPRASETGAPARVRALLERAVERHLMADVPVASFLSGGIDSSIVSALASRAMGGSSTSGWRRKSSGRRRRAG